MSEQYWQCMQPLRIPGGWGSSEWKFRLQATLNDDWMQSLLVFSTRSKDEVVKMLEQWLFQEFRDHVWIDELNFRKNYPGQNWREH